MEGGQQLQQIFTTMNCRRRLHLEITMHGILKLQIKEQCAWEGKLRAIFLKEGSICEASLSLCMDWDKARRSFLFRIYRLTNIYLLRPSDSKSKPQGFWSRSFPLLCHQ